MISNALVVLGCRCCNVSSFEQLNLANFFQNIFNVILGILSVTREYWKAHGVTRCA